MIGKVSLGEERGGPVSSEGGGRSVVVVSAG